MLTMAGFMVQVVRTRQLGAKDRAAATHNLEMAPLFQQLNQHGQEQLPMLQEVLQEGALPLPM